MTIPNISAPTVSGAEGGRVDAINNFTGGTLNKSGGSNAALFAVLAVGLVVALFVLKKT